MTGASEASGTTPGVAEASEARNTAPISPCPPEGASKVRVSHARTSDATYL